MDILSVIRGCLKSESKFQRQFYDHYKGFACKVVFRYIYRYEKAMDIVTDGFVKVFTSFDRFKFNDEESLEKQVLGWLRRIMINCSIDELRKTNMLPEIGTIPDYVWETGNRSDEADQFLLYKDLIKVIKELPTRYRVIFNLYVLDGYSHSEIADKLRISVSASRSSLSRAKAILQSTIAGMEEAKACSI